MRKERKNHDYAWAYFVVKGQIPVDAKKYEWCLHHVDESLKYTDIERYNEWRIEDLVPMRTKDHMSLHNKNKSHSAVRNAKISESLKGHSVSEETRKKIGDACRGKPNPKTSEGLKEYFKTHHPYNYGKPMSDEQKKKLSEAKKGKKQSEDTKAKRWKAVMQMDLDGNEVARYKSLKEAVETTGFNKGQIALACRKNGKARGYFWCYV